MLHVLIATLLMMVATFLIGLAAAWFIRTVANVLYYAEHRSFKRDLKAWFRLVHMRYTRRKRVVRQLASSSLCGADPLNFSDGKEYTQKNSYSSDSELIKFFYGNN